MTQPEKIAIENANHPGRVWWADRTMYEAMKRALLESTPQAAPGLTLAEIHDRLVPRLPQDLYPGGAKAGWWMKAVQLDLEAKGLLARDRSTPLRLRRT